MCKLSRNQSEYEKKNIRDKNHVHVQCRVISPVVDKIAVEKFERDIYACPFVRLELNGQAISDPRNADNQTKQADSCQSCYRFRPVITPIEDCLMETFSRFHGINTPDWLVRESAAISI
jgi:hypothetical protein